MSRPVMKGLPLWQPWATLIAIGAKRVETRHWQAPHWLVGRRVAIYATKGLGDPRDGGLTESAFRAICRSEPFASKLAEAGYRGPGELPRGALVATVVLVRCARMTGPSIAALEQRDPAERAFGDYKPGRWAWVLRDVERFPEPVPYQLRGQGIFDVTDADVDQAPNQGVLL